MSSQVQALLNDVKARRESALPAMGLSPFPDLDRTLQTLSEASGFSFNLDPKLAPTAEEPGVVDADAGVPFHGSFIDAFPALRSAAASPLLGPPGIAYPHNPARSIYDPLAARQSPAPTSPTLSYTGSFDPFSEGADDSGAATSRRGALEDGPPKMSRFGFARNGRQGGNGVSSANSPRVGATPLSPSVSGDGSLHAANGNLYEQWNAYSLQHHAYQSHTSSPLAQHAQAYTPSQQQTQQRFQQQQQQAYQAAQDVVSEAALRELIASSRVQEQQHRMRVVAGMRPLFV
jgi:CCR4-NOT transcription complex subunit 4